MTFTPEVELLYIKKRICKNKVFRGILNFSIKNLLYSFFFVLTSTTKTPLCKFSTTTIPSFGVPVPSETHGPTPQTLRRKCLLVHRGEEGGGLGREVISEAKNQGQGPKTGSATGLHEGKIQIRSNVPEGVVNGLSTPVLRITITPLSSLLCSTYMSSDDCCPSVYPQPSTQSSRVPIPLSLRPSFPTQTLNSVSVHTRFPTTCSLPLQPPSST